MFRLNIGVGKETFSSLFGPLPWSAGRDFTVLDQIMPHPVYAPQAWVCVLNPRDATFQAVRPLLAEAYDLAVRRYARVRPGKDSAASP